MAQHLPNLWRAHEDAVRLYPTYLTRLFMNGLHEKVIAACRQIRRYAARETGIKEGLFTFHFEIDALCAQKQFGAAWRQLRKREVILFGKRLDLAHHAWSPEDGFDLPFYYAPLLYFRGQYRLGCALLETWLGFSIHGNKMNSHEMLYYVYKGDKEPWDRYGVTLKHFYNRLGKDLAEWRHWPEFVNGFPPRLYRLTGVSRADMLRDASLLPFFFDNLLTVPRTSGSKLSLADLVDVPAQARRRQDQAEKDMTQFMQQSGSKRKQFDGKLLEWFPELAGLPL